MDAGYFNEDLGGATHTSKSIYASDSSAASELILPAFENIRNEISGSDFLATGYLVLLGTRPQSKEITKQYICISRRAGFPFTRFSESASGSDDLVFQQDKPINRFFIVHLPQVVDVNTPQMHHASGECSHMIKL